MPLERRQDFAHRRVELHDHVAARAVTAAIDETRMRNARHMNVVRAEIKEEWAVALALDEFDGPMRQHVGHVGVDPPRSLAARHESDAADAADDRIVVTVAGPNGQQFGIVLAGRLVANSRAVADEDRIIGVVTDNAPIFDIHARRTIARGWNAEEAGEADFQRAGLDLAVVIGLARHCAVRPAFAAEAEMPFADGRGLVARGGEARPQRGAAIGNTQRRQPVQNAGRRLVPPSVLAGQQRVARGRANRRGGMSIGEAAPFAGQPIEIRCFDLRRSIAAEVAVADVIGQNNDDVGPFGGANFARLARW